MKSVARSHDIAEMGKTPQGSAPVQLDLLSPPSRHPSTVHKNLSMMGQSWEHANLHAEVLAHPTSAIRGMVRGNDGTTSQAAATRILPKMGKIEARVLALITNRPSTAGELERLDEFKGVCSMNTVRTRISALKRKGLIVDSGEDRLGMTVWKVAP